jgi:hypothetical protein
MAALRRYGWRRDYDRMSTHTWRAYGVWRQMRHQCADPDRHAELVLELRREVESALDFCQSRCTARTLTVGQVLRAIREAPHDTGRCYVASSYGYSYTWTQAMSDLLDPYTVSWDVRRVRAAYGAGCGGHTVSTEVMRGVIVDGDALLDGDVIAIRAGDHYIRYAADGIRTGVAVRMPDDLRTRWGRYEHGSDLAECEREIAHKREILAGEVAEHIRSQRRARAARLLARLSTRLTADLADARAAGYCRAGISAWCASRSLDPETATVPINALMRDEDGHAQRLALTIAGRAVAHL